MQICKRVKDKILTDKQLNFKVDYSKLNIFDEYNVKDIKYPIVLSVPHKGTVFPEEFLTQIKYGIDELRSNEDSFVDELVKDASDAGIPMIAMNIARSFVDVNRDKIELDPTMFYNHPQAHETNIGGRRCRVGLGVIHRITAKNHNIYDGLLDYNEVLQRFEHVYDPYHKKLQQLIDKVIKKFGFCMVLDCHSMPSEICSLMQDTNKIDFCLGTLFEQSCPPEMHDIFKQHLQTSGYNVADNCPYSGAYITFNYCQPRKGIYSMQMEINRGIYMNEHVYKKNDAFSKASNDISMAILALGNFLLDFKK